MKYLLSAILVITSIMLQACTYQTDNSNIKAHLTQEKEFILPDPACSKVQDALQLLKATYQDKSFSLMVAIKINEKGIFISGYSVSSIKLFNISYDSLGIHTQSFIKTDENLSAQQILTDIMLALYPEKQLNASANSHLTIVSQDNLRLVKSGDEIVRIFTYDENKRLTKVQCPPFKYSVEVKSLK